MSTVMQPMPTSPLETYGTLIHAIGVLLNRGIGRLTTQGKARTDVLHENARQVIQRLQSESAKTAIANAFTDLDPTSSDALCTELQYVTANIIADEYAESSPEEDADAASDAKTGKDSLENLIGARLPKWLTHLLQVLNELLSIVFKV